MKKIDILDVNGKNYIIPVDNGKAVLVLSDLGEGNYTVNYVDDNYYSIIDIEDGIKVICHNATKQKLIVTFTNAAAAEMRSRIEKSRFEIFIELLEDLC